MKVQQSEEAEKQIRYVLLIVKRKIYQVNVILTFHA